MAAKTKTKNYYSAHNIARRNPRGPFLGATLPDRALERWRTTRRQKGYNSTTKSEMFQDDIFPPCYSGIAALSAEEWSSGMDKDPRLVSFTSDGLEEVSAKEGQKSQPLQRPKKQEAPKEKEKPVLKRWSSRGSPSPESSEASKSEPQTLEEYRKAYKDLLEENAKLKKRIAELEGSHGGHKHF